MPFQIFNENGFINKFQTWTDADGDSGFVIYTGDYTYKRFDSVLVTNGDTDDHVFDIYCQFSGEEYHMASCNVPAGSGEGGVPPVDIVALQGAISMGGWVIDTYDDVRWAVRGTINTGKKVHALAFIGTI